MTKKKPRMWIVVVGLFCFCLMMSLIVLVIVYNKEFIIRLLFDNP